MDRLADPLARVARALSRNRLVSGAARRAVRRLPADRRRGGARPRARQLARPQIARDARVLRAAVQRVLAHHGRAVRCRPDARVCRRGSRGCARTASPSGTCSPPASAKAASTRRSCPSSIVVNDFNAFFERHRRIAPDLLQRQHGGRPVPAQGAARARARVGGHRAARAAVDEPCLRDLALRAEARALGGRARQPAGAVVPRQRRCTATAPRVAADYAARPTGMVCAWPRPIRAGSIALASRRRPPARACLAFHVARYRHSDEATPGARRSISAACSSTGAASVPSNRSPPATSSSFIARRGASPTRPSRSQSRSRTSTCSSSSSRRICKCCRPARSPRARCSRSCARATRRGAEAAPAHRLGRGTSGLIAFGKTALGRSSLSTQAARSHARQDVSRLGRRRAPSDLVRGAATDRAHTARPADDSCRGDARAAVADARARAAPQRPSGRSSPRSRSRAGPIRFVFISRRPARRSSAIRCSAPGGVPKSDVPPGTGGYLLHSAGCRSIIRTSGARIRVRSLPDWLARTDAQVDSRQQTRAATPMRTSMILLRARRRRRGGRCARRLRFRAPSRSSTRPRFALEPCRFPAAPAARSRGSRRARTARRS